MSNVILCGALGYEAYPLLQSLIDNGHKVLGLDNNSRADWVAKVGGQSGIPIPPLQRRIWEMGQKLGHSFEFKKVNLNNYINIDDAVRNFDFDVIINLAAQPSAPYSQKNYATQEFTLSNNNRITRNLCHLIRKKNPEAHLNQASTMGEYGTPDIIIEEGYITDKSIDAGGVKLPFPRDPSSIYHLSKVYDSQFIHLQNKIWGLKATIFCQGVVYGVHSDPDEPWKNSRWDCDFYFGTMLNRFIAQSIIGDPMTVYGKGEQKRGLLNLKEVVDSIATRVKLGYPDGVEYINHINHIVSVNEIAEMVREEGVKFALNPDVKHIENPRTEKDYHQYDIEYQFLKDYDLRHEIKEMFAKLTPYKDRILKYREAIYK